MSYSYYPPPVGYPVYAAPTVVVEPAKPAPKEVVVTETLTHSEKVKELQKKIKALSEEAFQSSREHIGAFQNLQEEKAPLVFKLQQDVIDLQQQYYSLYNSLPKQFKDSNKVIAPTPAPTAPPNTPIVPFLALEHYAQALRKDIDRILHELGKQN